MPGLFFQVCRQFGDFVIRKAVECCKHSLVDHSNGNLDDYSAESNAECPDMAQKI